MDRIFLYKNVTTELLTSTIIDLLSPFIVFSNRLLETLSLLVRMLIGFPIYLVFLSGRLLQFSQPLLI